MSILMVLLMGMTAGILGAILGIGGGVVMLPASEILLGLSSPVAVGTTLFAVIFTSVSGAFGHYRKGNVEVKSGLLVALGGITGVCAGSYIFKQYLTTNVELLKVLLGIIFLIMAAKMAWEVYAGWQKGEKADETKEKKIPFYYLILLGIFTGTLTGLLGLGGGFIMVPAMMWMLNLKPAKAAGTTLLAMLPIALFGGMIKLLQGFVDFETGFLMGLGTVIGAQIGVKISNVIRPELFKVCFTIIFILLAFDYLQSFVHMLL
ncbi:sulfite exporter TauE/SafE family protein [Thermosyntropha sp.]|uniref:sulfite exporter TauE/SafE family protein n=1 Tax=Thermosyntropha sp. TaxID=2740820 RepID=UPI0025FF8350|nr:sulfite exporter TauE/SafE family protein [Thermosyntropha sp.]MBO8158899.1 sulfite exporter TauE/SafE family protein [Thermosyntropha sp.]